MTKLMQIKYSFESYKSNNTAIKFYTLDFFVKNWNTFSRMHFKKLIYLGWFKKNLILIIPYKIFKKLGWYNFLILVSNIREKN